jgi:hypothetical protein
MNFCFTGNTKAHVLFFKCVQKKKQCKLCTCIKQKNEQQEKKKREITAAKEKKYITVQSE